MCRYLFNIFIILMLYIKNKERCVEDWEFCRSALLVQQKVNHPFLVNCLTILINTHFFLL